MIPKRFRFNACTNCIEYDGKSILLDSYGEKIEELLNEQQYKIDDLLYQIGHVGKNNESCDGCVCFIEDIGYCWMWDMNVKKEDIVVACDKRELKDNDKETI